MNGLPNPLSNNLNDSLIAAMMNMPQKEEYVYHLTEFNVISLLMERMGGAPLKVESFDSSFQTPLMGLSTTKAIIATSTQSGNQVILTFSDPTYNEFRVRDNVVVNVSANVRGIVISAAPGTVTLKAQAGLSTSLPAASFPVNGWLQTQYNNHGAVSHGTKSQYETPIFSPNWVGKYRDTLSLTRDELTSGLTWVYYNGKKMWSHAQEPLFLERIYRQLEWELLFSKGGYDPTDGTAFSQGLYESIRDPLRGGVDAPQATMWSFDDYMDFIIQIGQTRNNKKVQLLGLTGRGFLQTFQQFTEPFVQYAGVNNTFGGVNVEGLDVMTATLAGVQIGFIIVPAFGNTDMNPTPTAITGLSGTIMDNFCFVVNSDKINSVDKMKLPAMRKTYAGKNETIYGTIRGVIETDLLDNPELQGGSNNSFATDEDSMKIEFLTRRGGNFICYNMGVWHVTQ